MIDLRLRAWMSISVQTLTQCCLQESDRLVGVIGGGIEYGVLVFSFFKEGYYGVKGYVLSFSLCLY